MVTMDKLKYQIAITLVKGVGVVLARNLIAYLGGVEAVFSESEQGLARVPGIGSVVAKAIVNKEVLERAEEELDFMSKSGIVPLFYTDENFPTRLMQCEDAPLMLFYKGEHCFNRRKVISVVGTRRVTDEGIENCRKLIEALAGRYPELVVVSGLAYGVDICAHRQALKCGLKTVSVLGHGLDRTYPYLHRQTARKIEEHGALMSEFKSGTKPDRQNFVRRNRIIAGLADATVVIESGEKGGSLITANMAASYNRDVLAFPGRVGDDYSKGCNGLIKKNLAALIEHVDDLEYALGWESGGQNVQGVQMNLFENGHSPQEQDLYNLLLHEKALGLNQISRKTGLPVGKVSALLLNLEFEGVVKSLPGNLYKVV